MCTLTGCTHEVHGHWRLCVPANGPTAYKSVPLPVPLTKLWPWHQGTLDYPGWNFSVVEKLPSLAGWYKGQEGWETHLPQNPYFVFLVPAVRWPHCIWHLLELQFLSSQSSVSALLYPLWPKVSFTVKIHIRGVLHPLASEQATLQPQLTYTVLEKQCFLYLCIKYLCKS